MEVPPLSVRIMVPFHCSCSDGMPTKAHRRTTNNSSSSSSIIVSRSYSTQCRRTVSSHKKM